MLETLAHQGSSQTVPMFDGHIRVTSIEDEASFVGLKTEWNHLHAQLVTPSVFLRHEWAEAAWGWVRQDSRLLILRVSDGDELIGLAPFVVKSTRWRGIRLRVVEFLAVPDTQVCEVLAVAGREAEVNTAVAAALCSRRRCWHRLRLTRMPRSSAQALSEAFLAAGLPAKVEAGATNPGLSLAGGWEAYYGRRSRRLKKGNNLVQNRLRRNYSDVELEWLHGPRVPEARWEAALDDVIAVSRRSWKSTTGLTLDCEGPGRFIRILSGHAAGQGWLSIWLLRLDGRPVATEYQLICDGHVYALRADFDSACEADSPGTYLNWKLLERLFNTEGLVGYHMGPGENPYKSRWAEDCEPVFEIDLSARNGRGFLLRSARSLKKLLGHFRRSDTASKGG